MDKESQTKLALKLTIAGQDFSDLNKQADPKRVFSNFKGGERELRAEDVFKDPYAEPVQMQPRRPVVVEVRRKRPPFDPKP